MSAMTDYQALLRGLESCRWAYMQGLADAAEDQGEEALAAGWRWLADNRKWPMSLKYGRYAFELSAAPLRIMPEHCLPVRLYEAAVRAAEASEMGRRADEVTLESYGPLLGFLCTVAGAVGECLLTAGSHRHQLGANPVPDDGRCRS
jgi:hypothetical protein